MARWRRICCPVDFSVPSRVALEEAARICAGGGASLTLLHVFAPPNAASLGADLMAFPPEELEADRRRELEPMLLRWREDAARLAEGAPVEARLVAGAPLADEILRFVAGGDFDLVVVGTHGRSGVKRLVLGSVAEHVVRGAPTSVLVARAPAA